MTNKRYILLACSLVSALVPAAPLTRTHLADGRLIQLTGRRHGQAQQLSLAKADHHVIDAGIHITALRSGQMTAHP